MKKSVLFSALALTASIFADGDIAAQMKSDKKSDNMMMDQKANTNAMVTLTSARPDSDNGWYIFADALYWHADVGSSEWARKIDDTTALVASGDLHALNFKWNWGFRVGIGVNMDHDMWDSNFYYTWFRTENSNSAGVPATGIIIDQVTSLANEVGKNTNQFTSGKNEWKIHYNMFDWELGRWYYVSKNLAVRPHVGVKGGWINQDVDYTFTNAAGRTPTTSTGDLDNNFWGVGPSGGVNMMWVLGSAGARMDHRFSLFGDFAGALLYGHFDVEHKEATYDAAGVVTSGNHVRDLNRNLAVPVFQTQMGLSWDTGFNNNRNHFTFKVGYEFQYWFRQNQQVVPVGVGAAQPAYRRVSDDLALQGLTVDFRFDF
jgi:hypothetical protein